jgi:hypothetical protein
MSLFYSLGAKCHNFWQSSGKDKDQIDQNDIKCILNGHVDLDPFLMIAQFFKTISRIGKV